MADISQRTWRGPVRPFRRDGSGDVAQASALDSVRASIAQILGTRAAAEGLQGELPWRPEFGSKLHLLRHGLNDAVLRQLAVEYTLEALGRWEPRALVTAAQASVVADGQGTTLMIDVKFRLAGVAVPGDEPASQTVSLAIGA